MAMLSQPLIGPATTTESDAALSLKRGYEALKGSGSVAFQGFGGEFLKGVGLTDMGNQWMSSAYTRGILMGMDMNDIDDRIKGPKTWEEVDDWKGAIAWGINSVADQIPTLAMQFAPAIAVSLLTRKPTLTAATVFGTIDFMNTAEVYSQLLMETGESRPKVAMGTGAAMSVLDMIVPMRVIGALGRGNSFAGWFTKKLKDPKNKWGQRIGNAIRQGATEGTTEYLQTLMEGMALNYVQEKDILTEFTQAQDAEAAEAGRRGALIGTLLGIPISYRGMDTSARKRANELDAMLDRVMNATAGAEPTRAPGQAMVPSGPYRDQYGRLDPMQPAGDFNRDARMQQAQFLSELQMPLMDALWSKYKRAEIELQGLQKMAPIGQLIQRRSELLNPTAFVGDLVRWKYRALGLEGTDVEVDLGAVSPGVPTGEVDLTPFQERGEVWETGMRVRTPQVTEERGPFEVDEVFADGYVKLKGLPSLIHTSQLDFEEISRDRRAFNKYKRDLYEAVANSEMVSELEGADAEQMPRLAELAELKPFLLEKLPFDHRAIPKEPDVVPPRFEGAAEVPVPRGQRRLSQPWATIEVSTPGKRKDWGWNVRSTQPVTTRKNVPKMHRGVPQTTNVYHNQDYVLKKETTQSDSPWVVISKETNEVVKRLAPALTARVSLMKEFESPSIAVTTEAGVSEERLESAAQRFDQVQGERGMREVEVGQKVRKYERHPETGRWEYPDDNIYTLQAINYMAPAGITGAQYTQQTPITTVYKLAPESGAVQTFTIGPTEDNIRIVPRLLTGWKYPVFFGQVTEQELITEEELFEDVPTTVVTPEYDITAGKPVDVTKKVKGKEVTTKEIPYTVKRTGDKLEDVKISEVTPEGERAAQVKEERANQARFDELIVQEEWADTLAIALRDAETARGENITNNLNRLSKKTESQVDKFIADSKKTKTALGIPTTARAAEELAGLDYQAQVERERLGEERELAILQRRGEGVEEADLGAPIIPEGEVELGMFEEGVEERRTKARKRLGQARGAITTYKKRRGLEVTAEDIAKQKVEEEAVGIAPPRRFEAVPKGASLMDVVDETTDLRPIEAPEAYEVKVMPEVARERGLNPEFFYPFETFGWTETGGYIKVQGNIINKMEVDEVQEITGRARAPAPGLPAPERLEIEGEISKLEKERDRLLSGIVSPRRPFKVEEPSARVKEFKERIAGIQTQLDREEITRKQFITKLRGLSKTKPYRAFLKRHQKKLLEIGDKLSVLNKRLVVSEDSFIEKGDKRNQLIWRGGKRPGVQARVELPESVPNQENIDNWWIDNRTGIIFVREKGEDVVEPAPPHYEQVMKAYLTWFKRDEHIIKLEELRTRLSKIYAETKDFKNQEIQYVDLTKDKDFLIGEKYENNVRGRDVTITIKPSIIDRINRERKKQNLSKLGEDTRFRVSRYLKPTKHGGVAEALIQAGKRRKVKGKRAPLDVFPMSLGPEYRKGIVETKQLRISYEGNSYVIEADSAVEAILQREWPDRIGVMTEWESLAEHGPEKGVRLLGTWRGDVPSEAKALEQFMQDTFTPRTHAFGRYGEHKDKFLKQRTKDLTEAKGRMALVEYFDGALIEGQIADVNVEAETFTLGIPVPKERPTAKQRYTHVEIGILDYDRIQVATIKKPRQIRKIEEAEISETDKPFSNMVYLPIVVEEVVEQFPTTDISVDVYRPRVDVRGGAGVYTIKLNGRDEENKFTLNEAIAFLNELSIENDGDIEVGKLPLAIVAENEFDVATGMLSELAAKRNQQRAERLGTKPPTVVKGIKFRGRKDIVDVAPITGIVTERVVEVPTDKDVVVHVALNKPVTITFNKGRRKPQKGIFTDIIENSVRFQRDKQKKYALIPLSDISFVYHEDQEAIDAEAEKGAAEIAKQLNKNIVTPEEEAKKTKDKAVPDPISDTVYDKFVKTGKVSDEVLNSIASKITETGISLSPREQAIYANTATTIEKILRTKVASEETISYEDGKEIPFGKLPLNQKFTDEHGGKWEVVLQVGKDRTILKWLGGTKPPIEVRVEYEGKKETVTWQPNQMVITDAAVTPPNLYLGKASKADVPRYRGPLLKGLQKGKKKEPIIPNFSVARDIFVDGKGKMEVNTGLTPKEFRDVLANRIGRMNLARLEKEHVRIVQNQHDVPNAPSAGGIKSIEWEGRVWFITNNIRREEITGVFTHDIGVHLGLASVYGEENLSYILASARQLSDSSPEWREAFVRAREMFDVLHETPEIFTDEVRRNVWQSQTPEQIEAWITEEAVGYYTEVADPLNDSFWTVLLDLFLRVKARMKMYMGKAMSEAEIIAFVRGAVRGTMKRNFEASKRRTAEHYSAAFAWDSSKPWDSNVFDKFSEKVESTINNLNDADTFKWQQRLETGRSFRNSVMRFFNTFRELPYEGLFRKLRSLTQGELERISELGTDILKIYDGLSEADNLELYKFFTNKEAKPEDISNEKLRDVSVRLKAEIMRIGQKAFDEGVIPAANKEQFEELQGAYLPKVFLFHILSSRSPSSTPFGFKTSERDWTKIRKELDDMKQEAMVPVVDVRYLLWRAFVIPQQDMEIMRYLQELSEHKVFVVDKETGEVTTPEGTAPWVMPGQWHSYTDEHGKKRRTTVTAMRREKEGYENLLNHTATNPERRAIMVKK